MSRVYNNKVGILTQYYKSHNYGGLLQSYALVQAIQSLGYHVEQICYDAEGENHQSQMVEGQASHHGITRKTASRRLKNLVYLVMNMTIRKQMKTRFAAMERFGRGIPHSTVVFTQNAMRNSLGDYSTYVVGSDQVWNPEFYFPTYFCAFVADSGIKCIAYAASVSQSTLTDKQKAVFKEHMKRFSAISLRENNLEIIQELTENEVQLVLDPTLLLSREQWDQVCAPKCCSEPYLFCYFLGKDTTERKLAEVFAKRKGLKVVTIPHLSGTFELADLNFGDIRVASASPEDFLSLIKHAQYVFTDSFHACVFSHIYHRDFFAFHRTGHAGMSTRINSLLELFGTEDRFCETAEKQTIDYLLRLPSIDYSTQSKKSIAMRSQSYEFLSTNLQA